jgi:GNAT superfamily N-acetyltransferase
LGPTPALRPSLVLSPLTGGSQDQVLVARLVRACSAETLRRRFFLPREPTVEAVLATYRPYLLAGPPDGLALAAVLAGQPIGLLNLAPAGPAPGAGRQLELGVLVADAWQRRGIGTALLDHALDRHAWPGWTIRATVQPDNLAVLALLRGRRQVRLVSSAPGEYYYELAKAG